MDERKKTDVMAAQLREIADILAEEVTLDVQKLKEDMALIGDCMHDNLVDYWDGNEGTRVHKMMEEWLEFKYDRLGSI